MITLPELPPPTTEADKIRIRMNLAKPSTRAIKADRHDGALSMIILPELPPPASEVEKIRIRMNLAAPSKRVIKRGPPLQFTQVARSLDLSKSFLDAHRMPGQKRGSTVAYSIFVHGIVLTVALLIPMWFADTLDIRTFTRTMLVAPPPPPAPATPSAPIARASARPVPQRLLMAKNLLTLPTYIPKQITSVIEPQAVPGGGTEGVFESVPGGVVGDIPGGVLGGALSASFDAAPPPPVPVVPAEAHPRAPVPVGGAVKRPRILRQVDPIYPVLAKNARIQGLVVISAVIDAQGNVVEMKVVSGHPLLLEAAMNALRQWKFEPTVLDGEPWPIVWQATLTFQLG